MPRGAASTFVGWSEWQAAQRRSTMLATCANGTAAVPAADSFCGLIRIASTAIATAALAGIHHAVRPMWRRLKKCRTHAPITSSTTRIEPRVAVPVGEREMVRQHREDDGQRQIVVVHRAQLSARVRRADPGSRPACFARTSSQCAGMITKKTLPTIIVPSIAPIWRYIARALNRCPMPQAATVMSTSRTAARTSGRGAPADGRARRRRARPRPAGRR